jgi:hypothetical protein
MELRIVAGSDARVARIFPRSTAAPSATATAQASPTADSSRARQAESAKIPCLSYVAGRTCQRKRSQERQLAPQHGFLVSLKFTIKTAMPKPIRDIRQSFLSEY